MNGWMDLLYAFLLGAALVLCALGLWFTAVIPGVDRWSKRFFLWYFIIFMLCCVSGIVEAVLEYASASGTAIYVVLALEALLLSLPLLMLTIYLLHCSGESPHKSGLLRAVLGLWAVFVGMLIFAPFIGKFSHITPDGQYYRGPLYPLLLAPMLLIQLLNFAGAIRRRKQFSRKVFLSCLVAIVPMTIALIVQEFIDFFPLLDVSFVLAALSMYVLVLSDQLERDRLYRQEIARQQQKIANQSARILVLQMRPHFIYNTMTSIYSLCGQDPQQARQVILDFTTYLRKNFTAVESSSPITFSSELEHTRAYLAVEQALYEDGLFVEFDTPHTRFRIPPLTLQPIVENAVKHGRDPYAGPFHISVRTRKTDSGSEIVVADDGRGFDASETSESGIALKNIRQRLEIMCGGSLTITPNDGGGTVVTLTIPDGAAPP